MCMFRFTCVYTQRKRLVETHRVEIIQDFSLLLEEPFCFL